MEFQFSPLLPFPFSSFSLLFTPAARSSDDEWTTKQLNGELESFVGSTYELQRKLVQSALSADSSGAVQSSFSFVLESSVAMYKNRCEGCNIGVDRFGFGTVPCFAGIIVQCLCC